MFVLLIHLNQTRVFTVCSCSTVFIGISTRSLCFCVHILYDIYSLLSLEP